MKGISTSAKQSTPNTGDRLLLLSSAPRPSKGEATTHVIAQSRPVCVDDDELRFGVLSSDLQDAPSLEPAAANPARPVLRRCANPKLCLTRPPTAAPRPSHGTAPRLCSPTSSYERAPFLFRPAGPSTLFLPDRVLR